MAQQVCKTCGSLSDGHVFCSLEPESWSRSRIVRADRLRRRALRRAGLPETEAYSQFVDRFTATPSARRDFYAAMIAAQPAPRLTSVDVQPIFGHSLDTQPEARVHWRVRGLTVCGRRARDVLHTSRQASVTCKQCTFEV